MTDDADRALAAWIRDRAPAEGVAWLERTIGAIAGGVAELATVFPAAGRHVGRGGLDAAGATLTTSGGEAVPVAAWRIDDAARVRLVLADAARTPDGAVGRAAALYQIADARERIALLRALSFLPGAATDDAAVPAVLDALRSAQGELFEAAICENPYASAHLPQLEWRKATLKAVFIGLAIERVARLAERADAVLAQSLLDLALEREAAHRAVPPGIWPIAARFPPPGLAAKMLGYLEHPEPAQRAAAAAGLAHLVPAAPHLRDFLADRAAREPIADVRDALARALAAQSG